MPSSIPRRTTCVPSSHLCDLMHLVFLPPRPGPARFFLWSDGASRDGQGPRDARAAGVGELADLGAPGAATIVTAAAALAEVPGIVIQLERAVRLLATLPASDLNAMPPSVSAWSLAAKLAFDLIARERMTPLIERSPAGATARWGVSLTRAEDADRLARLASAFPPAAHAVPIDAAASAKVWTPEELLVEFLDTVADALASEPSNGRPRVARWEERLLSALTTVSDDRAFLGTDVLERGLGDALAEWAAPARGAFAARRSRLCLKLDPPEKHTAWALRYFLQSHQDPSLLLPARDVWSARGRKQDFIDQTFADAQELLLRELGRASRVFKPIEGTLEQRAPEAAQLGDSAAWYFVSEAAPVLGEAGFGVMVPTELLPGGQRRLRLRMRVGGSNRSAPGRVFALDELLEYHWEAALGGVALSRDEFERLARLKRPLVQWRGQWVVLDPGEIAEMRRLLESRGGRVIARDALAAVLGATLSPEGQRPEVDVVAEGRLASVLEQLREGDRRSDTSVPADLDGTLRPYQVRGLGWLDTMADLGLGGCLADDMGLGKTVQTIAFLLARRKANPGDRRPTLIVCPMSVVGNWERELARFAPSLPVVRHHGSGRARTPEALAAAEPQAVVVTTYGMLRRDRTVLGGVDWAVAILDEAQNVKNSAAQQAAVARGLRATHRFALTGTPVENRLAELWSILEFCVPGYLGPLEAFRRRYAVPIERYRDESAAERLRCLVRPFVLRRLKSDPAIAPELPPKQEMPVVCTLTREQATLYRAAVDEALTKIKRKDGIERKGLILALLTSLKQICNHPAHYLDQKGPLPGRSGKLARLTEMLEETVAAGDRALVFTQYREMGDRLVAHLKATLRGEVLYLHGGVPRAARDTMVRRFQEEPRAPSIFVLSLRAGGTGLNLTRATRVFHFDRWWNPAVEDQATDRTHRIGQDQVVQVYRLLAAGTLEEKIDRMLEDKRILAEAIIGPAETWITELPDAELRRLVELSSDAAIAEGTD